MAAAYCTECGGRSLWRATRGARLADLRSPCCGAPMRGPRRGDPSPDERRECVVCRIDYPADSPRIYALDENKAACRRHPAQEVEAAIARWRTFYPELAARLLQAYGEALAREEGVFT
ncbi:MAG TPA: hypothetical protein VNO79_07725 [Actinomycetota bacterium]|nr:hypothetical protein [Actinomycetota bacterium]